MSTTDAKSVNWTIGRQKISSVPAQNTMYYYTRTEIEVSLSNFDETKMEISNGITKATNAGTYNLAITPKANYCWNDGSYGAKNITWNISKQSVLIPTVTDTSKTYNGSAQSPTISAYNTSLVTVSGNSATNAGNYTVSLLLTDTNNYMWSDSTITDKTFSWTIERQKIATAVPVQSGTQYATGSEVTVSLNNYDANKMTLGGTYKATVAGTYTATVTPKANYCWSDGTYGAKNITWTLTTQYKVMTVNIDMTNSNPSTSVTYADDAVGMTAGSASWDEWFGEYPVLFKDGLEVKKLNPNNFAQDLSGNTADITSGNNGDVMIAFPRRGLKISTDATGTQVSISMTDNPNDSNFGYYAHQRGTTNKDVFYLGAYKGSEVSSKLRSLSGKAPAVSKTIGAFRTLARANSPASNGNGGSGYDQSGFYQLVYRQAMYILKYKNLNSQSALGRGYVDGNSGAHNTGGTNTKGMTYGETTGKQQMKLFGLEDFWGNVFEWIDGMFSDSNRNILTNTQSFNNTGSGYTNRGQGATSNIGNYISKVQGTTEKGFIAKEVSGSATTYFCDYGDLSASGLPYFGSSWNGGDAAGVFRLDVDSSASNSASSVGARLMYL